MFNKFRIITGLVLLLFVMSANAAKEPKMKPVYMFGFAASFTDSIACQTVVQRVDSAWLDSHGFLVDRALYSLQLQMYMEQEEHLSGTIATVFFSSSERKMQRLWAKMRRKYDAAQNLIFHITPADKFKFIAEEYRPAVTLDTPEAAPADTQSVVKSKKKKKKS